MTHYRLAKLMFQFHTGSIKSKLNIEPSKLEGSFNSILVRLKV